MITCAIFSILFSYKKALPYMAMSVPVIAWLAFTLPLTPIPIAWHLCSAFGLLCYASLAVMLSIQLDCVVYIYTHVKDVRLIMVVLL